MSVSNSRPTASLMFWSLSLNSLYCFTTLTRSPPACIAPSTCGLSEPALRSSDEKSPVVFGKGDPSDWITVPPAAGDGLPEGALHVLTERVVRIDDVPAFSALLRHRDAGALGEHVGVVRVVERVLVAALAGEDRRRCRDVDVELLLSLRDVGDRERGGRRRHIEDAVGVAALVELLRLLLRDVGLVLVVRGEDFHLAAERVLPVFRLEVLDRHVHRLDGVLA